MTQLKTFVADDRACSISAINSVCRIPDINQDEILKVSLVDLSGEYSVRYTPLAMMCLKAAILADSTLSGKVDARLHAFLQRDTVAEMVTAILEHRPHVIGISCQGWNLRQISQTFSSLRHFLPDATIVLGGNHVTGRGDLLLPKYPDIDIVVNGEGEFTFCDLLRDILTRQPKLEMIAGLTYRSQQGIVTTKSREMVRDLAKLRSPYSLPDVDLSQFDIALLETNRGCPYLCAFCYWGGRVGQKLARSEVDRARFDIEAIGRAGIETIFLCDANFGILEQDLEITRIVVDTFKKYGSPREFNVNWAKNHAFRVSEIIRMLDAGGIHTGINIPLQTLSLKALTTADRNEMGRAEMLREAKGLIADGYEIYCELIFGMPGESLSEFRENYDTLFLEFPSLRIHPLWILPNTTYANKREELGIRTISPDLSSDYEAILQHHDMTPDDVRDGLALLLAHSNLNLLGLARNTLRAYVRFTGASASALLSSFEAFISTHSDGLGAELFELYNRIRRACYFERSLRDEERQLLYRSREESNRLICDFLRHLNPPTYVRQVCTELARYDAQLLPRGDLAGSGYVESLVQFDLDPVELSVRLARGDADLLEYVRRPQPTEITLQHKAGLAKLKGSNCDLTGSWNGRLTAKRNLVAVDPTCATAV